MKPTMAGSLTVLLASLGAGCGLLGDSPARRAQRAEKLALPVFRVLPWHTDFDLARQRSRDGGKLVLAYFTRSYAG